MAKLRRRTTFRVLVLICRVGEIVRMKSSPRTDERVAVPVVVIYAKNLSQRNSRKKSTKISITRVARQ